MPITPERGSYTPRHTPMSTQDQPSSKNASPAPLRYATLIICAGVAVSTLPWIWMALGKFGGFAWGMFGFELVLLLGCLLTMLVSVGKVRVDHAYPLAIACLIGTILVGAVFGIHVDARAVVGDDPQIGPWINRTLLFRFGAIGVLSLLATLDVYRRDPRSWSLALRSVLFLIPVIAALGWMKFKGMPTVADASGEPSPIRMILFLLGGLALGILFSIGGHLLIRSYEIALPEPEPEKNTNTPS